MINSWLAAIERSVRPQHSLGVASRPLLSILMLGLSLSFGAVQARAQCGSLSAPSTTWQNGGNSFWNIDGNWTSGTPTATTNACIVNGTSTVTLNTNGNANGLQLAAGNTLNINAGASLGLASGGTSYNYGTLTNSGAFNNYGTFFGVNSTTINTSGGYLSNYGMIQNSGNFNSFTNDSGALLINYGTINSSDSPGLFNNGTLVNSSGASLTIGAGGGLGNGAGAYVANLGTITVIDAGFLNSGTLNNIGTIILEPFVDGSSFSNSGTLNNSGSIIDHGSITCCSVFSNSGTINNSGTLGIAGGFGGGIFIYVVSNSGTLNNSGTINLTGTNINETFTNSGAVTISSSGIFTTSTNYTQTAGRTIVNGTLTATDGAIVDIEGGKLSGTGMINGDVLMKGIMSPASGGVPGTLTVNGNYQQASGSVFDEIIKSASANGLLDVSGVLALDPSSLLEITLQNGFNPAGDSFIIFDCGSLAGEFSNGTIFFAGGFDWTLSYGPHDVVLTAVSAPEPGSMSLIVIGFVVLLSFATKRRIVGRD